MSLKRFYQSQYPKRSDMTQEQSLLSFADTTSEMRFIIFSAMVQYCSGLLLTWFRLMADDETGGTFRDVAVQNNFSPDADHNVRMADKNTFSGCLQISRFTA